MNPNSPGTPDAFILHHLHYMTPSPRAPYSAKPPTSYAISLRLSCQITAEVHTHTSLASPQSSNHRPSLTETAPRFPKSGALDSAFPAGNDLLSKALDHMRLHVTRRDRSLRQHVVGSWLKQCAQREVGTLGWRLTPYENDMALSC